LLCPNHIVSVLIRIGIDASNLRAGGGLTHLVELLRAADPFTHGFREIIVWSGSSTLAKIEPRSWLRKIHDPLLDRSVFHRVYWQRFRLERQAKKVGCDVLFVPGGSDASGFRPMVTMSRNLLPFEWKELRRYGCSRNTLRLLLLRWSQSRTFRKADAVILLTQHAYDTVLKVTGDLSSRVAVVPHGIHARFFKVPRRQRSINEFNAAQPVRVLYVSSVDLYKHQWHVAEAVAQLRSAGIPVVLDLVGPSGPGIGRLTQALREVDPLGGFITYWGAVPYEKLHEFYACADIGVFASSCENMPNILLEGMAAGLPLACSRRGPMPEMLGAAGVYFDPERPEEIAAAIRQLIESAEYRAKLAEEAYQRAQAYSWQRCANETFELLAQVAAKPVRSLADTA